MTGAELMQIYANLFVNHKEVWFQQWITDCGECQYACKKPGCKRYITPAEAVKQHLIGTVTASWPAVDPVGMSRWACGDSDHENGDIPKIQAALAEIGFTAHRESIRAGREGHLWLFLDQRIPAADLLRFNQELLAGLGIKVKSKEAPDGVEFFPSYSQRFSQVRGPLGIHRKPEAHGRRGWFADVAEDIAAQIEWLATTPLNQGIEIANIARNLRLRDPAPPALPARESYASASRGRWENILQLVPAHCRRWTGREWFAQCPLCAAEGHDGHRDNLRISADGRRFCCVYGGPGQTHKAKDILLAINA